MFINPYVYSDDIEIEKVVNPYFLSSLTPANALNPHSESMDICFISKNVIED